MAGCTDGGGAPDAGPTAAAAPGGVDTPESCVDQTQATRSSVKGTAVWALFCPGAEGRTTPAEVPSDALIAHLDLLASLDETVAPSTPMPLECRGSWGRTYRVHIGYADGEIAEVTGHTDPSCFGRLTAGDALVQGPDSWGVYGVIMRAFGRQYADDFASVPPTGLVCPEDPREPDSVSVDGSSSSLDTGYHLGTRAPMTMPLSAVRGIVCTWPYRGEKGAPDVRRLTPEDAERVRIGLHAITGGIVDCQGSPNPTYTAVVEDRTGTRRAVTIIESECSTVIRSNGGGGLGFEWLDR